ncbi:zinc-binding loop region of homing endonuclease-domain-containing protein [Lipomyces tetrasporus]|uniref:Zinc-binding loop region of homing endonuclease-domain-containing protein n=1 Tax=Lipomyces tetrasporus TaxID=54092 RepID=A0AAD7QVP1_9ASCO|nr:zinc-binding loop region of homing endonuclease-domain-containing protein [Lipomyces tetrasporus]KAJ8102046.1 zinc-binding loop region of homing endonuclease-domain-containing protein [Lipomyces tetrasporus]
MTATSVFDKITQEKANEMITQRHVRTTDLGCWESNSKADPRGYVRVKVYVCGEEKHSAKIHQISLIASNRRDELKMTLGRRGRSTYDISHLCHNSKCFNPEHLIVESGTNNRRRKICNGQKILVHDGFSYHPCPHGKVEKLRKCILPLHHLEKDNTPNSGEQTSAATTHPHPDDIATLDADADDYDMITPKMAQKLLDRYRGETTGLGCWLSKLKVHPGHSSSRVILKNLPVRPSLSRVALIATNRRDELQQSLGKRSYYLVTHLCHDNRCINPEHIIVESRTNNHRRKTCIGKTAVVREGATDHPCPHGSVEKMRTCILPVEHGQDAVATSEERDASTEPTPAPDLNDEATEDTNATTGKLDHITPIMAQELVEKYRAVTTDIGCWESGLKGGRYGRVLATPLLKSHGVSPFLHQLAVIATNRGDELKKTLDRSSRSRFDVSHLCHNGKCFNPEHLIVESNANNLRRQTCNGHKVIIYGNFAYHPCPHDGVEKMQKCILPTLQLEAGHHENDTMELLGNGDLALNPSETEDGSDVAIALTDDHDDNDDKNVSDVPSLRSATST